MRDRKHKHRKKLTKTEKIIVGGMQFGIIVGLLILWVSESIILSLIPVFVFPLILALQENIPNENMQPQNNSLNKKKHIRSFKRKEHVQQQLKTKLTKTQKETNRKNEEKLLSLLEVDQI